jgi:hypothetical protein
LTPAAGRHTLAGVDALKLMAALNPRGTDDDDSVASSGTLPDCGPHGPLPDLIERDGEDAGWFRLR